MVNLSVDTDKLLILGVSLPIVQFGSASGFSTPQAQF